jgi:glucosylceramidase
LVQVESTAKNAVTKTLEVEDQNEMTVFVNKTNDYLKIDTNHEGEGEVEIYSLTGQSVLKRTVNFTKGNQSEIEISRLPKGLYIVNIKDDKGTFSKKVLKQ